MVWNVYISIERDIGYQTTSRSLAPQMHASQSSPFESAHITRNNQSDPSMPPDRWNRDSPCHSCTVSCFDQCVTSSIKKKILYDAVDFIAYILSYKYDRMIYYHIFACIFSGRAKYSINHRSLLFEYIFFNSRTSLHTKNGIVETTADFKVWPWNRNQATNKSIAEIK